MPYGMPNVQFIKVASAYFLAMAAGSQFVHWWYSPDLSIPEIPPKKGELHTKLYTRSSNSEETSG